MLFPEPFDMLCFYLWKSVRYFTHGMDLFVFIMVGPWWTVLVVGNIPDWFLSFSFLCFLLLAVSLFGCWLCNKLCPDGDSPCKRTEFSADMGISILPAAKWLALLTSQIMCSCLLSCPPDPGSNSFNDNFSGDSEGSKIREVCSVGCLSPVPAVCFLNTGVCFAWCSSCRRCLPFCPGTYWLRMQLLAFKDLGGQPHWLHLPVVWLWPNHFTFTKSLTSYVWWEE